MNFTKAKPLPDSDYYNSITPHKPAIYRKMSGYCTPEMYVDPKGLYLYEKDGSVWVRNTNMNQSNNSNADVIAVIPKSQVLSLYQALQNCLNDKGFLDSKNELPDDDTANEGSGHLEEYVKHGLRM